MMPGAPPLVDPRSSADIDRQVRRELATHVPGWSETAPDTGAAAALIRVFSRYAEIVLERINKAPERNRLMFLQQLGVKPLPAQPATVPVTFVLSAGARHDVIVPAGSQVSTAAAPGQPPIVFETTRQLTVTATKLVHVFLIDPHRNRYAELTDLLTSLDNTATIPPELLRPIEHIAFIGHPDFFGTRPFDEVALFFDIDETVAIGATRQVVAWSLCDGTSAQPLEPSEDTTAGLTRSGVVRFGPMPTVAPATVDGVTSRWIRAEMRSHIEAATVVKSVTLERGVARTGLRPDAALFNTIPLDLSKDVLPFGEQPRPGDVFALASAEALSLPDAMVGVAVTVTRDAPPAHLAGDLAGQATVLWEYFDGEVWQPLGTGRTTEDVQNDITGFSDTTRALTRTGVVTFRVPKTPRAGAVGGQVNYWLRARLMSGGYGEQAQYIPPAEGSAAFTFKPATLAPPLLQSVAISYSLAGSATTTRPETILAYNDFTWEVGTPLVRRHSTAFEFFRKPESRRKAVYFALDAPEGVAAPSPTTPLSVYVGVDERAVQYSTGYVEPGSPLLDWEYPTERGWKRLVTTDSTRSLTRSGTIEMLPPPDIIPTRHFGKVGFWVRVSRRGLPNDRELPIVRLLLNTVETVQAAATAGARGNVPADTVVQLKTAIPYIERVTNPVPATGGADAEAIEEFRTRVPGVLRHQHRAVTRGDYEDLARLASSDVARAKCVPLSDLESSYSRAGAVSLVIVPRSPEPRPLPSVALLDRVHEYIAERQSPAVTLFVAGPRYRLVDVDAAIVVTSLDRVSDIDATVRRALERFLHPLHGGIDGSGWGFGRRPHRSDLFSLISAVDGVDHVRAIAIRVRDDAATRDAAADVRTLISPGIVQMSFSTEPGRAGASGAGG